MTYDERKTFLINCAFFFVVAAIVFVVLRFMMAYLFPFLIGIILAYALQKPSRYLSKKLNIKNSICAPILVCVTYITVIALIGIAVWLIVNNSDLIVNSISRLLKTVENFINDLKNKIDFGRGEIAQNIITDTSHSFFTRLTESFSTYMANTIKRLPGIMLSTVVTIVASCYIAKDFDVLNRFLKNLLKAKTYDNLLVIKSIVTNSVLKFAVGYMLILMITFVELLIGLVFLNVNHAVLLAAVISVVDLLPVLGTGTVMVPWAVFSIIYGRTYLGFGLIILYVLITVIRNFIEPKIIGKKIGVSPLFTLVAIFVGLRIAGIIGMFILPVVLIVVIDYYKLQMENQ